MCHGYFRNSMELDHVLGAVRRVYDGRMCFHDGTDEIAPGVTVHLIGGHSGGLQVVRVPTPRGNVVLAADATHFWANIRTGMPFPIVVDIVKLLEGYRTLERLADGPDHIIPGHDPLVRTRFPPHPASDEIVRLDLAPIA
jgi:glyoxylase-like metal-dependent hydrolase (beta-lactamase superfamily II)